MCIYIYIYIYIYTYILLLGPRTVLTKARVLSHSTTFCSEAPNWCQSTLLISCIMKSQTLGQLHISTRKTWPRLRSYEEERHFEVEASHES